MKETITDFEVPEPKEVTRTQYRSDCSGQMIEQDELISLIVPRDASAAIDDIENRYDEYGDPGAPTGRIDNERERYRAYSNALRDVERLIGDWYVAEDTIHLHIDEYAALTDVDVAEIDVDTVIPETSAGDDNDTDDVEYCLECGRYSDTVERQGRDLAYMAMGVGLAFGVLFVATLLL